MDPSMIWQAAMDAVPLLILRGVAVTILGLSLAMVGGVIGAVACHTFDARRS